MPTPSVLLSIYSAPGVWGIKNLVPIKDSAADPVLTEEISRFRPLDIMSSKVKNTVRLLPFSSSKKSSSLHRHQNYRLRSVDSRIYIPLGGGLRSSPVICYHRALSSSVVASIHRRATNRPGCDKLVASMSAALKICTLSAFYAIPRPPTQSTRSITSILPP